MAGHSALKKTAADLERRVAELEQAVADLIRVVTDPAPAKKASAGARRQG